MRPLVLARGKARSDYLSTGDFVKALQTIRLNSADRLLVTGWWLWDVVKNHGIVKRSTPLMSGTINLSGSACERWSQFKIA